MGDFNNRGDKSGGGGRGFGGGRGGRPSFGGDRNSGRSGGFGGVRGREDRPQMYQATCGDCGESCEVPFRPSGDRPVLCKDCFRGNDDRPRRDSGERSFSRERGGRDDRNAEMHRATCSECGDTCEVPFKPSADKPVFCSECFGRNKSAGRNSEKSNEQLEMINAKLDKILALITPPVIAVSKEMQKEQSDIIDLDLDLDMQPKLKKARKKVAKK